MTSELRLEAGRTEGAAMDGERHYHTLQLRPGAPRDLIERAYWHLISVKRPPPSEARVREWNEAYGALLSRTDGSLVAPRSAMPVSYVAARTPFLRLFSRQRPIVEDIDHYELLKVARDADAAMVAVAYDYWSRRLDSSGIDRARIDAALRTLEDPSARAAYDARLRDAAECADAAFDAGSGMAPEVLPEPPPAHAAPAQQARFAPLPPVPISVVVHESAKQDDAGARSSTVPVAATPADVAAEPAATLVPLPATKKKERRFGLGTRQPKPSPVTDAARPPAASPPARAPKPAAPRRPTEKERAEELARAQQNRLLGLRTDAESIEHVEPQPRPVRPAAPPATGARAADTPPATDQADHESVVAVAEQHPTAAPPTSADHAPPRDGEVDAARVTSAGGQAPAAAPGVPPRAFTVSASDDWDALRERWHARQAPFVEQIAAETGVAAGTGAPQPTPELPAPAPSAAAGGSLFSRLFGRSQKPPRAAANGAATSPASVEAHPLAPAAPDENRVGAADGAAPADHRPGKPNGDAPAAHRSGGKHADPRQQRLAALGGLDAPASAAGTAEDATAPVQKQQAPRVAAVSPARAAATLTFVDGPLAGTAVRLDGEPAVIGAADDAAVRLPAGDGIADRHARIWRTGGRFALRQLDGAATVDGAALPLSLVVLDDGDVIGIGPYALRFEGTAPNGSPGTDTPMEAP